MVILYNAIHSSFRKVNHISGVYLVKKASKKCIFCHVYNDRTFEIYRKYTKKGNILVLLDLL